MRKIDLGQTITILANVAVIAGIIFLGYELRQNNELMSAEARFNRLAVVTEAWASWAQDGELTELRVRAGNKEPLSEVEYRRVDARLFKSRMDLSRITGRFAREKSDARCPKTSLRQRRKLSEVVSAADE